VTLCLWGFTWMGTVYSFRVVFQVPTRTQVVSLRQWYIIYCTGLPNYNSYHLNYSWMIMPVKFPFFECQYKGNSTCCYPLQMRLSALCILPLLLQMLLTTSCRSLCKLTLVKILWLGVYPMIFCGGYYLYSIDLASFCIWCR
jgi:hypothetical protein